MTAVVEAPAVYAANFAQVPKGNLPWLDRIRERAFERFSVLGFPTTREEDWRFTNLAPIARVAFGPAPAESVSGTGIEEALPVRMVFVNGRFAPELSSSSLPAGVQVGSLASALAEQNAAVEKHLARHASFEDQSLVALNTALLEDGAFIEVARNAVIKHPIHLVFISTGMDRTVACPRILALIGEGSQVSLIEEFTGAGDQQYFTNAVTEVVAGAGAIVDHYKVQREARQAFHVANLRAELERDANFTSHSISLGGALVRNDLTAVLSDGAECTLNGFYMAGGAQHVDNHTAIDHARPHGTSHELYKGILEGKSVAVFNGKILVRKDAQKTDARQTNKNLVLSEDATINTKPELQIFADDVRCTHGATIGQIDQEAIFYLQSRGISREEARGMLVAAFARDVLDRIKFEPLRDRVERMVFERLAGEL